MERRFFVSLFLILLLTSASALADKFMINKEDSKVGFSIIKFKIGSPVPGEFSDFSGEFDFNPRKQTISDIQATIKTQSVSTNNTKRDAHLRTSDFFDVKKFPEMRFKSVGEAAVTGQFEVKGTLTMKGISKNVTLKVTKKEVTDNKVKFEATTEINRLDFNVTWNSALEKSEWKSVLGVFGKTVLDNKVKIKLEIEGNKKS